MAAWGLHDRVWKICAEVASSTAIISTLSGDGISSEREAGRLPTIDLVHCTCPKGLTLVLNARKHQVPSNTSLAIAVQADKAETGAL